MDAENRINVKLWKQWLSAAMPWISLAVVLLVFWWLKLTGITLAGEAFCGISEHEHNDSCIAECTLTEHIHTASCYSDITADVETREEWEKTVPLMDENMSVLNKIVFIACSQIGYKESELNFNVDLNLVRRGYTRYGDWYGNSYADWNTVFVSFCLHYAGMRDLPMNAGAEVMKIDWEYNGRYGAVGSYSPQPGDVVFLDKNLDGRVDTSAIFLLSQPGSISVVEGDLDNEVKVASYPSNDRKVVGYGISAPTYSMVIKPEPEPEPEVNTTPSDKVPNEMSGDDTIQAVAKEPPKLMAAKPYNNSKVIATKVTYSTSILTNTNNIVVYTSYGTNLYAFDGYGNAVPITVGDDGIIRANIDNPDLLLWKFTRQGNNNSTTYVIQNVATGKHMHAYSTNETGVVTDGGWQSTVVSSGGNVKIRSNNSDYARLDAESGKFVITTNANSAANFSFGVASDCYIWLDGTNGGIMSLGGSPNICYTYKNPSTVQLPSEWQSPEKYAYKLQGWYDVTNGVYYPAGAYMEVKGNAVLYADWVAASYDIGVFNAQVADTISTNHIITTNVFDYNFLFNVLSQNSSSNISASSHSETWSHVSNGNVKYNNQPTIDFIFSDNDSGGKISMANNRDSDNSYSADTPIKSGILTPELIDIVFGTDNSWDPETGTGVIGKTYLGTGDYLFRYMTDTSSEFYGYYYYDASLNAASYNQSEQRFYVYDYLARSSDSSGSSDTGKYSDFLPLNSPYANTNGQTIPTYTYNGVNGEYSGISHFQYDARYNTDNSAAGNVAANLAFGMSMEMRFYLPDDPGSLDETGKTGNRDLHGNEMIYHFSGDDDLWVLVDGKVVLDMGGIHQAQSGVINFSTGIITINGKQVAKLSDFGITAGDHIFEVYYLDRGSSQSNCSMYFNIAPRYSLDIYKEDVLTREVLDGAEFTVYTDRACTQPAVLWSSKEAYDAGLPSQSTFRVTDGVAKIWGMSPGKNYYIKETRAPDADGYDRAKGVIHLTFDIKGIATFEMLIDEESPGEGISGGYTVHNYKVDTENQAAYMTVTNAQIWVKDVTSVQAIKAWDDNKDHSADYISVYLSIKDPDGTVRRIREAILGAENNWHYTWKNLPKYAADGVTEIEYIIEESYFPGYTSTVERVESVSVPTLSHAEAYTFSTKYSTYLLKTSKGYLATTENGQRFEWVDEETALELYHEENSRVAWSIVLSGSNIKLTNGRGRVLTYNRGNTNNSRYFYPASNGANYQTLIFEDAGDGVRIFYRQSSWGSKYYVSSSNLNSSGYMPATTSSGSALVFVPMVVSENQIEVADIAYKVTNTPLDRETSLKVTKEWDVGLATGIYYDNLKITVKLFANGKDTGRTLTLSLKNGWTDTFRGLPYADENGDPIVYTIGEGAIHEDWEPIYGEVITIPGTTPTYETTVTNSYRYGHGYELPSTGGIGGATLILCGLALMAGSLVCGYVITRKRERRRRE